MTIVVVDLANVAIDGVASGSIPDVLANHGSVPGVHGFLLDALQAWHTGLLQAHADQIASLEAIHAAALAAKDAEIQTLQGQIGAMIEHEQ